MAYLLSMLADGASPDVLVFEVEPAEVDGDLVLASPDPGKVAAKAKVTFDEALAKVKPSLQKVAHLLKELSPDEAEIEFGLKMGGETGIIVAKGTAEVNFVIRLSWKSK